MSQFSMFNPDPKPEKSEKKSYGKRKCKNCGETFEKSKPLQATCSIKCAIEYTKQQEEKKKQKAWRKEKKEKREKLKTKKDYEGDLQAEINLLARLIDKGCPCMMCGMPMSRINGCHYHSVGSNNSLRFNLLNVWAGCHSCNAMKGGNIIGYDEKLIETYGREKWEYIKFTLKRESALIKLSVDEIKEVIKKCRHINRSLTKLDKVYSAQNRWIMREKYNKQLGIYS